MSRRQQRIDLGLGAPHEAISAANVEPLRIGTPPASPIPGRALGSGPPSPIPLYRSGPTGEDPFAETRVAAREAAAAGQLCPANQHGCPYFSASEWRFCVMCEWETGVAMGKAAGTLVKLGVSRETFEQESARGQDLAVTEEEMNEILRDCMAMHTSLSPGYWATLQDTFSTPTRAYFTRSQIHNLLMIYGAPQDVLTEEKWAELKARYDGLDEDESAAIAPRPPLCPLLEALGLVDGGAAAPAAEVRAEVRTAPTPAVPGNEAMAACVGDTLRELLEDLQRERDGLPPLERPPSITSYERLPDGRVRVEGGRAPVLSLAEIMRQEAAGIGPKSLPTAAPKPVGALRVARGPPPPAEPPAAAQPQPRIQVWKSLKLIEEEQRAERRAAEEQKMLEERQAAYHKRRQEELEASGAPKCYTCGWFGHIARVCRNAPPPPASPPLAPVSAAPYRRGLSNNAYRRIEREYQEDLARERAWAARRAAEAGKPAPKGGRTLADFLGDL